ncbi:hypothetical protein [Dysgonomonas gadei]|uniref:Uncharacterized protein n=1 Tax=Dysgonomonas gadei ATCC BAA-286 TaxID=742766 RepID=F5IVH4_9BACT|nr:hypothetical protein [Dysgonomonas gadei]EGK02624.1 hypothetical protein HMPREF9455_00874 [Dysgonomonas gadei ATCC BAA-286]
MKHTIYRIFSKNTGLIILTFICILFTIYFVYLGTISEFDTVYSIIVLCYIILNILLIRSVIFPIIKINKSGITSYGFFRKRELAWHDVKDIKLLKSKTQNKNIPVPMQMYVEWKYTDSPETHGVWMKRTNTYIILSKKDIIKPNDGIYSKLNLYRHIAASNSTVAFAYDKQVWKIIEEQLPESIIYQVQGQT